MWPGVMEELAKSYESTIDSYMLMEEYAKNHPSDFSEQDVAGFREAREKVQDTLINLKRKYAL